MAKPKPPRGEPDEARAGPPPKLLWGAYVEYADIDGVSFSAMTLWLTEREALLEVLRVRAIRQDERLTEEFGMADTTAMDWYRRLLTSPAADDPNQLRHILEEEQYHYPHPLHDDDSTETRHHDVRVVQALAEPLRGALAAMLASLP